MSGEIDIKTALRAFSKITADGKCVDNRYHLGGITAYTDYDGYTVTLRNDFVCLNLFFHNKFSFEYANNKEKQLFLEKIGTLGKRQN